MNIEFILITYGEFYSASHHVETKSVKREVQLPEAPFGENRQICMSD